jgi:hypothetical protein
MMLKVPKKNAALLQQELNFVINPLKFRHERYSTARLVMRQRIVDYFFNASNEAKLLDVMRFILGTSEETFVNPELMLTDFQSPKEFIDAILNSGLGLVLEEDMFVFPYNASFNEETLSLMKQLAHALNAYSTCYGLEIIYDNVLYHEHVHLASY